MIRSIKFLDAVNNDNIVASCEDGVLKVAIGKRNEEYAKKTERIAFE
jgi:HSP20 family molecular chaperone IbpA